MTRKRLLLWLVIAILLVWVLTAAVLVIRANLYAFGKLLYSQHNNLSASSLFLSLLREHTLFILSAMFALLFLTLYIVTAAGIDDILKCALLLLSAAGFVMCAWNRDALFFTSGSLRAFWLHTHDAMLLFFGFALLSLLLPRLVTSLPLRRAMIRVCAAMLGICAALLWFNAPVNVSAAFLSASILFLMVTAAFLIQQIRRRGGIRSFLESLLLLVPCALMRLRNDLFVLESPLRRHYLNTAPYVAVFCGIGISAYVLVWQMSNIFLQRSQNRRFEEIMKIKTAVSGLLVNYCRPPAKQITALSSLALDGRYGTLTQTQRQILFDIQDEVNKLNRALRNIGEFEALPAAAPPLQMQPIRLGTIFKYVMDELPDPFIELDDISLWREEYALSEPYSLIRANAQLCSAIAEIRGDEVIHIACRRDGHHIQAELSLAFDQKHLRRANRIRRIVNQGSLFAGVEDSSDMSLYITHSIFARHGSLPRVEILKEENAQLLRCRYSLPYCSPQARTAIQPGRVFELPLRSNCQGARRILLFSTSGEEIELMTSLLAYEPYRVFVVTEEKTLLQDMNRLRDYYSLLIIGSTFTGSSIHDICWMVREHHTLGQLPILLVQRDPDLRTHIAARELANSVTTTLSDRFEFCQKVRALVELKASVESTYASRLAFLQAQMNPHFIFNTMNTIMAMCLSSPMRAYDLLGDFSHYLRSSLFSRNLDVPYPVYEEVDLLTAYLSIEKARFGEQINYEIESNVPDDWSILPMLIEPLVENSVKHGKHGAVPLHIQVCLEAKGELLSVIVRDDGAGFDPERQTHPAPDNEPNNRSIGLENVRTRLKLFYNEQLRVDSAPGKGTRVSFAISPVK